jgi:tetratricopeptide (TPR) repeat protein
MSAWIYLIGHCVAVGATRPCRIVSRTGRALRWGIASVGTALAFAISWIVTERILHIGLSEALSGLAAAIVAAPLSYWAGWQKPDIGMRPSIQLSAPIEQAIVETLGRPSGQLIVGDIPGAAVALQSRAELEQLTVLGATGKPVVSAVTGMRGVGKSQLAAAYARLRVGEGWPVVVWVTAESAEQIAAGLADLADAAGIRTNDSDTETAAVVALRWLRQHEGPCLLVYDNAEDPEILRPWLPNAGHVQVVVTAVRDVFADFGAPIAVDVFTPDQARGYLHDRTGLDDADGADALAAEVGYLPLALAQAGALIGLRRRYPDYASFLTAVRAVPVNEVLLRVTTSEYPRGAAQAMQLAFADLAANDRTGRAIKVMDRLAVLAPTGVTFDLLDGGLSRSAAREALSLLFDRALATSSADGTTVGQHRLVQRVRREQLADTDELTTTVIAAATALESALVPLTHEAWSRRSELESQLAHIDALWDAATTTAHQPAPTGEIAQQLLRLRAGGVGRLIRVYDPRRAIDHGSAVVADCERMLGPDHPHTLGARDSLAGAYESAGRVEKAIPLYEGVVADYERVLGRDHRDTLISRNNLAYAYQAAGRLDEAIPLYEATLADRERLLAPDHPDTLISRNNLAGAYQEAGRLDQAIALFEATLADQQRGLGPDHRDTLTSRHNLAGAYQEAGRLDRAIPLFEAALADYERVLGPDHPETLTSRNTLAGAYRAAGRLDRAIPLYEAALADRERVLGPDHPETLTSRNNLAGAYEAAGRLDRAIPLYETVLADRERVLDPDHPSTLASRNNLASAYASAGRLDEAIPLYEAALADSELVLGPDHPSTLTSRNNLAYAYRAAGQIDRAVPLYEATLADRERVLGADHPSTLTSRNNLAYAYQAAGRLDEAIALFEVALAERERVLGPDHPDTLGSRNNLAFANQSAGRLDEAIALHEATLVDYERALGPDHPDTLNSRNNLAGAYQMAGQLDRAIPLFEATLTDCERVLGAAHPLTGRVRGNLQGARVGR